MKNYMDYRPSATEKGTSLNKQHIKKQQQTVTVTVKSKQHK
jgi:hypothetical protein